MSKYSLDYLAKFTAIGFTAKRGTAWHYRKGDNNHYEEAVPLSKVRELIGWEPVRLNPYDADMKEIKDYKGVAPTILVRSDNHHYLGTVTDRYAEHGYTERLINGVADLIDTSSGDLGVASVVVLDGGKKAVIQIESPETVKHSSGEEFRPFIGAFSSLDGSWKTSFKTGVTRVVCDNTMDVFEKERSNTYSYRNTKNSGFKVESARQALDIVFTVSDDFTKEMELLQGAQINAKGAQDFMDLFVPINYEEDAKIAVTKAETKRDKLFELYYQDDRVSPYTNTAWGILQMVNTYEQHEKSTRGETNRFERNTEQFFNNTLNKTDHEALAILKSLELV